MGRVSVIKATTSALVFASCVACSIVIAGVFALGVYTFTQTAAASDQAATTTVQLPPRPIQSEVAKFDAAQSPDDRASEFRKKLSELKNERVVVAQNRFQSAQALFVGGKIGTMSLVQATRELVTAEAAAATTYKAKLEVLKRGAKRANEFEEIAKEKYKIGVTSVEEWSTLKSEAIQAEIRLVEFQLEHELKSRQQQ